MSITREEATVQIYGLKKYCEDMADSDESGSYVFDLDVQALDLALTALRPVSRERIEKVWRGEWIGDNDEKVGSIDGSPIKSSTCSACGNWLVGSDEYDCAGHFCPACGAAQTDEAVEMVMERLEALKDGSTSD